MKILFVTVRFHPSHGGVQTVVRLFCNGLLELGHEVRVLTAEASDLPDEFAFRVIRKPGPRQLIRQFRWADRVVLHGVSVALSWPALFVRRPTTAIHYMPDPSREYRSRVKDGVRRAIYRRCRHLSVSDGFRPPISQPYRPARMPIDTDSFRLLSGTNRDRDLLFVGRLFDFKGVHDLLDAVLALNARGRRYTLTLAGDGAERESLARRVRENNLADQVDLLGPVPADELVRCMNRHKLIVVPSRYHEPFGLVAVEGIACGCVAVGTSGGGLPGAIGPCGVTVNNGDVSGLAAALERLMESPREADEYRGAALAHVAKHAPRAAAAELLRLIST